MKHLVGVDVPQTRTDYLVGMFTAELKHQTDSAANFRHAALSSANPADKTDNTARAVVCDVRAGYCRWAMSKCGVSLKT